MLKSVWRLLLLAGLAVSRVASAGEHTQDSLDCSLGGIVHCRYWMPPSYDAKQRYPIFIYLHGAGQRGTDNVSQVDPGWGSMFPAFWDPEARAKYPAFLMAPQCPDTAPDADPSWDPALDQWQWVMWDWSKGSYDVNKVAESRPLREVLSLLATLRQKYSIDPDRIYIGGESMGGFGTWDLLARHPDIFAAAVPSDGGGSPQAATAMRGLPIWSVHNADDSAVPVTSDRQMFSALAAAGGRIWYTEGGTGGHGASGRIMNGGVAWLFAQRRGTAPAAAPTLSFQPDGGLFPDAQQVTMSSSIQDLEPVIRYTTDGKLPSESSSGYTSPLELTTSAVVIGSSKVGGETPDDYQVTYHAAPFQIGATPLPVGAEVPSLGGSSNCGRGMDTSGAGGGGSSVAGAASIARAGAPAASTGGAPIAGPSQTNDEAESEPSRADDAGCACRAAQGQSGTSPYGLIALSAYIWRRRQSSAVARACRANTVS